VHLKIPLLLMPVPDRTYFTGCKSGNFYRFLATIYVLSGSMRSIIKFPYILTIIQEKERGTVADGPRFS